MQVTLRGLYMAQGHEIKKKMKSGAHVVISFDNTVALGASTVEDLKEFVGLPNVEFVHLTDCVRKQLGIESTEDVLQMSFFDAG